MNEFLQNIAVFATGTGIWVYLFIFFGNILEVTCGTLRIVLINRGVRTAGSIIAFIEIILWLLVASSVLVGFRDDFWKGVIYALAFAMGNYLGSWLDELLAFGSSSVQVIIPDVHTAKIVQDGLRAMGFGVTEISVRGRDNDHSMLLISIKRNRLHEMVQWIEQHCSNAVITVSDVKSQHGGYFRKSSRTGQLRIGKG